ADAVATRRQKGRLARRRHLIVIALIGVAVVVVVTLGDWYQQRRELRHLQAAEQRADLSIARYRADVRGCAADQLGCFATPATRELAQISGRRRQLEDVSLLPWHSAGKRCRKSLADYYRSWEQYLHGIVDAARSSSGVSVVSLQANVDSSFRSAQRACD